MMKKRAFIEMTLEEIADNLGLKDGVEIVYAEARAEIWPVIRFHMHGESLPETANCHEGECARLLSLTEVV